VVFVDGTGYASFIVGSKGGVMSEQQNVDVVRRGYEAFGRGDLDALLSLLDEDVEWTTPGPVELPTSGTRRGLKQVADFFKAVEEVFEIQRFEPKAFVAQGDRVIVLGEETSRVKATGKVLSAAWAHAFTLRSGKVVAMQEYLDTAAIAAELRAAAART
jgi:ketosteroid isomerase-like protein